MIPTSPGTTDIEYTWFGYEGENEFELECRRKQCNLLGPAGYVAMEDAERRAVIMCHPAFDGKIETTSNLISAFTVLQPGDKAPPHRHTAAAIRFATRCEGALTIVNGRRHHAQGAGWQRRHGCRGRQAQCR